ncbi:MAG: FAD-binding protein [Fimbriimonadaceae bacterium]
MRPESLAELADILAGPGPFQIRGSGTKRGFLLPSYGDTLDMTGLRGVVEIEPADQVAVAWAGTPLDEFQSALAEKGQCLPYPEPSQFGVLAAGFPGTLGGLVSLPLPHANEARAGTIRDWLLGLTLVRADGTTAACGSKAVKNVAGYDVQKLIVGARGTLAVVAQVVVRTYPLKARPVPDLDVRRPYSGGPVRIQRTLPADFAAAVDAGRERLFAADPASSTLWMDPGPDFRAGARFREDWVLVGTGDGPTPSLELGGTASANSPHRELVEQHMRRAEHIFDPKHKLNPGAMGVL